MAGRWGIAFASWIGVAGALAWLSFPGCAVAQQPPAAQSFTQPPAPQVPDRSHAPQLFRQATIARSAADQPSPTFSQSGTSASLPSGRQRHAQSEAAEPSGTQRFSPAGKESSRQEADGRSRTRKSDASSSPAHWLGDPKNVAALLTSVLIIGGGLLIFYRVLTRQSAVQWDALSVQTLGTIFFFPTLIVLDGNGQKLWQYEGYLQGTELIAQLDKLRKG